ncbi:hypothetical protein L596_007418 [Steinernema carpocapsae]|uniref:Uncharacterized protein n=1 Tax=Steinernema carpocapsae TaxID=34508 RepID=A0A4U5P981_STECR|nr:hypothetical protein L596_007418 [Steinernema carpocapsae]
MGCHVKPSALEKGGAFFGSFCGAAVVCLIVSLTVIFRTFFIAPLFERAKQLANLPPSSKGSTSMASNKANSSNRISKEANPEQGSKIDGGNAIGTPNA